MPLSVVESPDDWDLFEPRPATAAGLGSKRRKLNEDSEQAGIDHPSLGNREVTMNGVDEETSAKSNSDVTEDEVVEHPNDIEVAEAALEEQPAAEKAEDVHDLLNGDIIMEEAKFDIEVNGIHHSGDTLPEQPQETEGPLFDSNQDVDEQHASGESSPAPPPRRITRALAAGNNGNSGAPTPPFSPSPTLTASDSSLLQVDPIFLLPPAIHAANRLSALCGLPADEATETRKLLTAYIQKQEECVRGLETLAAKLISALKLRREVWDMCKAEGHVGELSDGEDWIDAEAWGLKEGELRKGRFEEEDIQEEREAIGGGRKGKRRRREQN